MMEAVKEFDSVYKEYEPKVSAYIRNRVSDPVEVKALCDNVFHKFLQNKERFSREPDSVSSWIYMTTKQTVDEHCRVYGLSEDTEEQTLNAESLDKLADALEQLDVRSRDIIILHYYAHKTLDQIAAAMDISCADIELLYKEALDKFQKYLKL
ncbi:MAG: sigma-70 family RNA polymerase sigma factor [Ruminiclostridium sp.]